MDMLLSKKKHGYVVIEKQLKTSKNRYLFSKSSRDGHLPSTHSATCHKSQREHHHELYQGSGLRKPMLQTARSYL